MRELEYTYSDGGREESGRKGTTGDCVARAISIYLSNGKPTGKRYNMVWNALNRILKVWHVERSKAINEQRERLNGKYGYPTRKHKFRKTTMTPDNGCYDFAYTQFLSKKNIVKVYSARRATMTLEQAASKYRNFIANVTTRSGGQHQVCVLNGVLYDNWDSRRSKVRDIFVKQRRAK